MSHRENSQTPWITRTPEYWLQIVFKSNERPWRHDHYSVGFIKTRADAIKWASAMRDDLSDYQITLFEDGVALDIGDAV